MIAKPPHVPVLLTEIIEFVAKGPHQNILDVTFGRGGHTREILQKFSQCRVHGLDHDAEAIHFGEENFKTEIENQRLKLTLARFVDGEKLFDPGSFDFILADLGVSSPQLDQAERGFSFYHDGPLDMRMDTRQESTAAKVVNESSSEELIDIFQNLGEVRRPDRVVKAIVEDRKQEAFATTRHLAGLIERVEGWREKGHHPATRFFLALRLYVNQELSVLETALPQWLSLLKPEGRLAVITFHSLEDRIVKWFFKGSVASGKILTKKAIQPKWAEKKMNPRARSAKLRVFQRGSDGGVQP